MSFAFTESVSLSATSLGPDSTEIPRHHQSLDDISGTVRTGTANASLTATWTQLTAGASYGVYVFGFEQFADIDIVQDVTIAGETTLPTFTQTLVDGELQVNDEVGTNTRTLKSYEHIVQADTNGNITLTITPNGGSNLISLGGLAIREILDTAPVLTAFARNTPASSPTNADTLIFDITFDQDVLNVSADDFTINGTTATGAVAGSGSAYTLTVAGGNLAGLNGTVDLDLAAGQNITDAVGNALPSGEPATDESYLLDNTAPVLTAFARNTPATSPTNADTLIFDITFDGDVLNVSAGDFTISGTTATGVLAGSGSAYTLTVAGGNLAGLNGTVGLDLAAGQNITDPAGNALPGGEPATDESYLLDNTAPVLTAFARNTPASSPTNADTLVFDITFDGDVLNVSDDDFTISGTTATGVLAGSGSAYTLTVAGGNLAGLNGTVDLDLAAGQNITDPAGNALPAGEPATDESYVLDNTAPVLTAFARNTPASSPTNADTLVFDITFDENVVNVSAGDFVIDGTSATGVLAGSGSAYTLTVSGGNLADLNGTVDLDLAAGQDITDAVGNALPAGEPATDESYLLDNTAPVLTAFTRKTPATSPTNADTLVFLATFSEDVQNVDAADFAVTGTTATIARGAGDGQHLRRDDLRGRSGVLQRHGRS